MQGVAKYFPAGEAAVQSLITGNDMLCLLEMLTIASKDQPGDPRPEDQMEGPQSQDQKVLYAKFQYGRGGSVVISTEDLNWIYRMNKRIAAHAMTLLRNDEREPSPVRAKTRLPIGLNVRKWCPADAKGLSAHLYYFDNTLGSIRPLPS
jgi:hypothetical protein